MRLPDGTHSRDCVVRVRVTPEMRRMIVLIARTRGVSISGWIRHVLAREVEASVKNIDQIGEVDW